MEIGQKMHFLLHDPLPRQIAGMEDRKGLAPLCELLGIADKRTTIRDQIQRGELDSKYQSLFAERFAFSLAWDEWKSGSAKEFKERYGKANEGKSQTESSRPVLVLLMEDMWADLGE